MYTRIPTKRKETDVVHTIVKEELRSEEVIQKVLNQKSSAQNIKKRIYYNEN